MVVVLLIASVVECAGPTFEQVLQKFPAATLPITITELSVERVQLTAEDVVALGFMKDTSASLTALRKWKDKPFPLDEKEPAKKFLWPVAAIQRSNSYILFVRYEDIAHMYQTRETFLLSYDLKGGLLSGVLFHASNGGEGGEATDVSTLTSTGEMSRHTTATFPVLEAAAPSEVIVTSEQRAKLSSAGAIEVMPTTWTKRDGLYVDQKSKEELLVIDKRVFYRANRTKPSQELEGDGNSVRFKNSPKLYVLTWNDRRSEVSCKNPDGSAQIFARLW